MIETGNFAIFSGDRRIAAVPADDRGLAYGDGLFETMRAHRGAVPWWEAHWARLQRGADRLKIAVPDSTRVRAEAERLLHGGDGVLKLVVSRGVGGRGYAPPRAAVSTWMLSRHPLPPALPVGGITLRWCDTRLATQPVLAGLKHCNRLEQVLARAEWGGTGLRAGRDVHEGLMRSLDGDVVCATAANLFVLRGKRWLTPRIDRCGVEGVCRAWVLEALDVEQVRLQPAQLETADAVFLCNAVRGILPVARLDGRVWRCHPQVAALQQRLTESHPGFADPGLADSGLARAASSHPLPVKPEMP